MNLRFDGIYSWISPACLALATSMFYLGTVLEGAALGWQGPLVWALCGGFAAVGAIFSLISFLTAKQHLRVARARIVQYRREGVLDSLNRPRKGFFKA